MRYIPLSLLLSFLVNLSGCLSFPSHITVTPNLDNAQEIPTDIALDWLQKGAPKNHMVSDQKRNVGDCVITAKGFVFKDKERGSVLVPFNKTHTAPTASYGPGTYGLAIYNDVSTIGLSVWRTPVEGRWIPPMRYALVGIQTDDDITIHGHYDFCFVHGNYANHSTQKDQDRLLKEMTKTLQALRAVGVKVALPTPKQS